MIVERCENAAKTIVERYGYEGDSRFIGRCKRTFKRPLILGECSEIHCVRLLVSWPAPLAQYLPFLVNRIDSFFFTSGDHSDRWWKGALQASLHKRTA